MKILLGLSGGVDSAVAARLLLEQGHAVFAHWLDIGFGGREEAAALAAQLGIPFSAGDIRGALEMEVCHPFAAEYLAGKTPLPCARCNRLVKFPALFAAAEAVGATHVATGHYAAVAEEGGEHFLHRGMPANDQSYMLARLPKALLSRIVFPLGGLEKREVRDFARGFALPVAEKPDSMEICFIPDGDYAVWLEARGEVAPPGNFVDRMGRVLGQHRGIHHYTIGQRRGLAIAAGQRIFVSELDPVRNEVILSDGSDLFARRVFCDEINRLADFADGTAVTARLRHSKDEYAATLRLRPEGILIETERPARAPTPGQLAVFYQGERVLGSGWITGACRESCAAEPCP